MTNQRVPQQADPDLRRSLRLPARPLLPSESTNAAIQVQVRIAAVRATAQMFEGAFLRKEIDMDEFLASAAELENWIHGR
jgi:hypothetical protein